MNLYAFRPNGHGPQSFFVMAESEEEARMLINARIALRTKSDPEFPYGDYGLDEWTEGNYEMKVYMPGQVATNSND